MAMRQYFFYTGMYREMQDYLRRCIDFDIENSKIPKVIKDKILLQQFRTMMVRHYRNFKDAFYFLSRGNPTVGGIYSMAELQFMGFLEEQKYITKRVTQAKIMLKLYACLAAGDEQDLKNKKNEEIGKKPEQKSNNKLISRPQFMEFLVRLAFEKWCAFNPTKKKKEDIDKDKLFQDDIKELKNKKQGKNLIKLEKSQKLQKQKIIKEQVKIEENLQEKKADEAQVEGEEQQNQMKKFKLKLPLPLIDGIERTMTSLSRYADNYRSSTWRKRKYLKIDILIVIKAYEQFLSSLYEKYTESKFKTNKPKRISNMLTLEELKNLILDTDIRRTKEAMKEVEQAFIDSKRLEVQDGVMQFALSFDEFQECLARIAEIVWFNPPCAPNAPIWDNQINRKNTPLFIKFESLIVALYWRIPELHNRRMGKIVLKGIFELEIEPIMQRIEKLSRLTGSFVFLRRNSMAGDQQISLRQVIQELRQKFDKMVVHREDVEEFYTQMEMHPE